MIDSDTIFSIDPYLFGALRAGSHHDSAESNVFKIVQRERLILPDSHVAEIENLWIGENSFELFAQTGLHLLLVDADAILRQAAGFDLSIDQDDAMSRFGEFAGAVDARRTSAHDGN